MGRKKEKEQRFKFEFTKIEAQYLIEALELACRYYDIQQIDTDMNTAADYGNDWMEAKRLKSEVEAIINESE